MSEKAPRSNPFGEALDNFDTAKAEKERQDWESELQGEAGKSDFSDEARQRLEDLRAYHEHMENLANETRTDYDRGLDRLESGEQESAAYNREWDDAIAENEAFDAAKQAEKERGYAEDEALTAKFAENANLRQMDRISEEIHHLRNKEVDPDTVDADERRLKELEDRLQELLERYAESEDYDEAIADAMMDRDDTGALDRAAKKALAERESRVESQEKQEKEDPMFTSAAEIVDFINKNPEEAERLGLKDRLKEIIAQIDEALNESKKKSDLESLDDSNAPVVGESTDDLSDLDGMEAPHVAPEEGDDLTDLDDKNAPLVESDQASDKEDHDHLSDLDDLNAPEVAAAPEKRRWYQRAMDRANLLFLKGMMGAGDRLHLPEKKSSRVATVFGVVALAGVTAALTWKYGIHHGGHGGGANAQDSLPQGGGNTPQTPDTTTPVVTPPSTPELPSGNGAAYPWDWAEKAVGADKAESWLHEVAAKASADGHNIQWHGSGTHEWMSVDGNSDTQAVIDALRPYGES